MEKILEIKEVYNVRPDNLFSYDGYEMTTSENTYLFLIENGQCCCENWGYFSSSDNVQEFVNSTLKEIKLVGTVLNVKKLKDIDNYMSENDCMFINLETNKGTLQLTVYNQHNGYYGHSVRILKNKTNMFGDDLYL